MVIIYRMPDGRLIPIAEGTQPPPGAIAMSPPVSPDVANQMIQAAGGATQGGFVDSQMQQVQDESATTSQYWTQQAAQQAERASRPAREAERNQRQQQVQFDQANPEMTVAPAWIAPGMGDEWERAPQWQRDQAASQYSQNLISGGGSSMSGGGSGGGGANRFVPWSAGSASDVPMGVAYPGTFADEQDLQPWQYEDPAGMTQHFLNESGFTGPYAGRGYLEDAWGAFSPLYEIMNNGNIPTDQMSMAALANDFLGGVANGTGGSSFVNTPAVWDQMLGGGYAGFANGMTESQNPQAQYQMVQEAVRAMSNWMNETSVRNLVSLVDRAWRDYVSQPINGRSFIDYLRSIGADQWM